MKHKFIKKYVAVLFLFTLVTTVHADSSLVKGMVHLDQAYIPVLAYTSADNLKASRVSFRIFENVWSEFKGKYYLKNGNDPLWKSDFDKIDGYIRESKLIITRGKNLKDAHEELEHVRVIMMRVRERNGIDYYIDHLTRFHEPMEKIVLAVKDKTDATLTDNTLSIIKSTLPEAMRRWRSVSSSKFDASLFEFSKTKVEILRVLVKKEKAALARLQKALNVNNKAQIIQAGLAIKPNFAKLFKAFGRFPKRR